MLCNCLPICCASLEQLASLQCHPDDSCEGMKTVSSWEHLVHRKHWPRLRYDIVWYKMSCQRQWRDWPTSVLLPLVGSTNCGYRPTKSTAHLPVVRVVIILIGIDLPSILWCVRLWIEVESCSVQWECYMIAASRCCSSHAFRHQVFLIITSQIIWIKRGLTKSRTLCPGEMIAAWRILRFSDDSRWYLGKYLCALYILNACCYWVGWDASSSGLISMVLSHFWHDHNIWEEWMICAEIHSIPVIEVSSA